MKQQVSRLSPHQNGKVFGVLSAIVSLIVLVPVLPARLGCSAPRRKGVPLWAIFIAPVIYLIVTYIMSSSAARSTTWSCR
jgi:uncharacterized membrane protein